MRRTTIALAVGLVCCLVFASGLGAAATTGEGGVAATQVAADGVVATNDTGDTSTGVVEETAENTTETVDETTDEKTETTDEDSTTDASRTLTNTSRAPEETVETANQSAETALSPVSNTTADVSANTTVRASTNTTADASLNASAQAAADATARAPPSTPARAPETPRSNASAARGATGPESPGPNRSAGNPSSEANGSAAGPDGSGPPGLGGEMPTPDGKTVAVGVGATVAAGAAGRAYVGATGGSPSAAHGVAQSGVPLVRTAYRDAVDRLWRVLGIAGYALHSGDTLEHDTRADLASAIEDNPGAYLSELADASDASMSTVRYHLKVLEREAVVTPVKIRGKRRYFPGDEPTDELAAALADDATESVLRALATVGPASVSALADELDRDPSTVTHHLDRLQESGLVERERDGRAVVNSLAPTAAAAITPRVGDRGDSTAVGSSPGD
ncbi:helix-turn-helix domain-containing protein [Halomicroarcula sp. GCM10025709]|uniref:helix-turn-helix domain-containing protein n=1 Tax=Haloarcula TaxID=2237 RepID=UPI0024C3EB78|nr:helix-turn-helix domain-containing protein [Halomicroarcula sp. YJ-61-S]